MSRGSHVPRFRVVFSLLMAAMLMLNMSSPLAFAQEATPEVPAAGEEAPAEPVVEPTEEIVPEETTEPVDEPTEPASEPLDESAPVENVDAGEEAVVESPNQTSNARVEPQAAMASFTVASEVSGAYFLPAGSTWAIYHVDGSEPVRSGGWDEPTPLETKVEFEGLSSTSLNDSFVMVINASPAFDDFKSEPFNSVAGELGPFNLTPAYPETSFEVTVNVDTWDDGTAAGADVAIEDASGNLVKTGTVDENNQFLAGELLNGDFTVTVDGSEQGYNVGTTDFSVDGESTTVDVELLAAPVIPEPVTFTIASGNTDIATNLPAGTTWEIYNVDGSEPVRSGSFETIVSLPRTITTDPLPSVALEESYVVRIDAPFFVPFKSNVIDGPLSGHLGDFVIDPSLDQRTIDVVFGGSAAATFLPAGAEWAVFPAGSEEAIREGVWETPTPLPATISMDPLPAAEWFILVIDGGHAFDLFISPQFQGQWMGVIGPVPLMPSELAEVTINVSSADESIADTLPADATWTVTHVESGETFSDTFAEGDLELPAFIEVENLVPYGQYDVTVDAGPTFVAYNNTFTIDNPTEPLSIVLEPVTVADVTIDVTSTDLFAQDELPADASWTVSVDDTVVDGDTFAAEHLDLPAEIPVNNAVPFGEYTVTVSAAPNFVEYTGTFVVDSPSESFTVELVPATYATTIVAETSDGGSAEGAIVTIDDLDDDAGEIRILAIEQIIGELDADNAFDVGDLPAGDYSIIIDATQQGYGIAEATFSVPGEGPVAVALQLQAVEVTINVTSAEPTLLNTLPEDATWTVTSVEDPTLSISDTFAEEDLQLPAEITVDNPVPVGSYLVEVDAGPDFEPYIATFEVTAESAEQTFTIVLVPVFEEPTTGIVGVVKFYCPNMSTVTFFDLADLDDDQLDFLDEDCVTGPATFTFYLVGDGTDDYVQLEVNEDGYGIIELDPGTYEVIEEGTQAGMVIEVVAGEGMVLGVINPLDVPELAGTVEVLKLYCEGADEVIFFGVEDIEEIDEDDIDEFDDNCVTGEATFTFYLVGDGTAEYQQLVVGEDGLGAIDLAPGTYEVVEEGTQATTTIEVVAGEVTFLGVINPMPDDGETDEPVKDEETSETPVVTKLPDTGSGAADTTGAMAMAAAAAAALAGAGALTLRKRQ